MLKSERLPETVQESLESLEPLTAASPTLSPVSVQPSEGYHEDAPLVSMIEKTIVSKQITVEFSKVMTDPEIHQLRQSELGLLDNLVEKTPISSDCNNKKANRKLRLKDFNTCQTLRALFPPSSDLDIVFKSTTEWWNSWHCLVPSISQYRHGKSLQEFVFWGLCQQNPNLLALALQCVVFSVYQTRPGTYDHELSLPIPMKDLMGECLSTIEKTVIGDDDYAGNFEGLEVIVMQGRCYVNLGQPQKAWLLLHRAISVAQLLGLHRKGSIRKIELQISESQRQNLWWTLNELDRYLSLVLGLPYAVDDDSHGNQTLVDSGPMTIASYRRNLSLIALRIMQRNMACPDISPTATTEINQALDDLENSNFQLCSSNTTPEDTYQYLVVRFWHNQMKSFLHLPFMLRSQAELRFPTSYHAAFSASREMLRLYHLMRLDPSNAFHMCRVIDFQAFTAAMLILLGRMGQERLSSVYGDADDVQLVDTTIKILQDASSEYGGSVAAQSVKVLNKLRSILHINSAGAVHADTMLEKISVPYFGTIKISKGPQASTSHRDMAALEQEETQTWTSAMECEKATTVLQLISDDEAVSDGIFNLPQIDIDWNDIPNTDLDQNWDWFSEEI